MWTCKCLRSRKLLGLPRKLVGLRGKGWTDGVAARLRKDFPEHAAFRILPFSVEQCGYMDKEAVKFVNRRGEIAAKGGHIPKRVHFCAKH